MSSNAWPRNGNAKVVCPACHFAQILDLESSILEGDENGPVEEALIAIGFEDTLLDHAQVLRLCRLRRHARPVYSLPVHESAQMPHVGKQTSLSPIIGANRNILPVPPYRGLPSSLSACISSKKRPVDPAINEATLNRSSSSHLCPAKIHCLSCCFDGFTLYLCQSPSPVPLLKLLAILSLLGTLHHTEASKRKSLVWRCGTFNTIAETLPKTGERVSQKW